MLNGKYCGNCANWVDTRPTEKGKLPYYGNCAVGRPFKKVHSFTIRTDGRNCKDWRGKSITEMKRNNDGTYTVTDGKSTYYAETQQEALQIFAALADATE